MGPLLPVEVAKAGCSRHRSDQRGHRNSYSLFYCVESPRQTDVCLVDSPCRCPRLPRPTRSAIRIATPTGNGAIEPALGRYEFAAPLDPTKHFVCARFKLRGGPMVGPAAAERGCKTFRRQRRSTRREVRGNRGVCLYVAARTEPMKRSGCPPIGRRSLCRPCRPCHSARCPGTVRR